MRIMSMEVANFLSWKKATFDFRKAGLVLIEGMNGAGKSSILDALIWCLFGTTLRGYENDDVINRRVGDDCLVTVGLEDNGDGIFEITRARRHSKLKNSLRVTHCNFDEDMTSSSNAETQLVVEKLLGCSMQTFLSSVVFGQDSAYRFSSLTDKQQKDILDEVLGVERFSAACQAARAKVAMISVRADQVRRDMEKAESARDVSESEAEELKEKDVAFEGERAKKLTALHESLRKAREWIKKNNRVDVDKLKDLLEKAQQEVTAREKAVSTYNKAITAAKVIHAGHRSKADDLKAQVKKHEALSGDCPTCGKPMDNKKHLASLLEAKEKLVAANREIEKADLVVATAEEQLADAERRLKNARDAAMTAQRAVNEALGEVANAKAWKQRVADNEARIAETEKDTNPYAALTKKATDRFKKHRDEAVQLSKQLAEEEGQLKLSQFWVEAFGARGLRSLLLDSSLPLLNQEASRVSRAITGGAISIEFSATSDLKSGKTIDRFEVKVDNKHGAASYVGNSAGEKAKVDLCVGLALQKLVASRSSASFNIALFDEAFDHLDATAHESVIEALGEMEQESVFVVSHNADLSSYFPATWVVTKKNGFSTVET